MKHVAVEACKQREMKWMKDLRQSIYERWDGGRLSWRMLRS